MSRAWVWVQLIIGWLPVWVLFATMIMVVHDARFGEAALIALRMIVAAAALGIVVHRLTARLPWPHPFELSFVGIHVLGAAAYSFAWLILNSAIESLARHRMVLTLGPGLTAYLVTGVWMYVMVAGVAYSQRAAQRTAQIQSEAARAQLAALRAQLDPHFLFNALHTVVQLIPEDPRAAQRAAEQLAAALRTAVEEQRDRVPLSDEWAFVERYLAIECVRFGDRLRIESALDDAARDALLPAFALQTLVENAVVHGAAPKVEPTTIRVAAQVRATRLVIEVSDDGAGIDPARAAGTGLARLRERLGWLYGASAELAAGARAGGGYVATLSVPLEHAE